MFLFFLLLCLSSSQALCLPLPGLPALYFQLSSFLLLQASTRSPAFYSAKMSPSQPPPYQDGGVVGHVSHAALNLRKSFPTPLKYYQLLLGLRRRREGKKRIIKKNLGLRGDYKYLKSLLIRELEKFYLSLEDLNNFFKMICI